MIMAVQVFLGSELALGFHLPEAFRNLLEKLHKALGFETLQVTVKVGALPAALNGVSDFVVSDPNPPRDPVLLLILKVR